jgi:hypothetical protein
MTQGSLGLGLPPYRRFALAATLLQASSTKEILSRMGDASVTSATLGIAMWQQLYRMQRVGLVKTSKGSKGVLFSKNDDAIALLSVFEAEYHRVMPVCDYKHYLMREKKPYRPLLPRFAAAEILRNQAAAKRVLSLLDKPMTPTQIQALITTRDAQVSVTFWRLREAGLVCFVKGETAREVLYRKNEAAFALLDDFDQRYNHLMGIK